MEVTKGYEKKPFWSSVHRPLANPIEVSLALAAGRKERDGANSDDRQELLKFCGKVILFVLEMIFW